MQIRLAASVIVFAVAIAACDRQNSGSPTAPTPTASAEPTLSLQGINATPEGTGVHFNTDFQFTAAGTFPSGTEFDWNFGDGTTATTTSPTVSRIYAEAGVFGATVTARRGGTSASAARQVSVKSLLGRWFGKITGFSSFPLTRRVPITEFELIVANQTPDGNTLMLHGRWADDAGCRENRVEFFRQRLEPVAAARVTFGVNQLSCASGDFYLTGDADAAFNRVEGHCNVIGNNPDCRFTMTRE